MFALKSHAHPGSATGDLDVTESVQILGGGADVTTIDGNGLDTVIDLETAARELAAVVPDRGHVPFLDEAPALAAIHALLERSA